MKSVIITLLLFSILNLGSAQVDVEMPVEEAPIEAAMDDPNNTGPTFEIFYDGRFRGIKDNRNNQLILPSEYESIEAGENWVYVVRKGLCGVFDAKQKAFVVPIEFDDITMLRWDWAGYFMVKKGNKYGLLNKNYQTVLDAVYDDIKFPDNYALIKKDGKYGVAFFDGKKKNIPLEYDDITSIETFRNFSAKRGSDYTLLDHSGNVISEGNKMIKLFTGYWRDQSVRGILVVNAASNAGLYDGDRNTFILEPIYEDIVDAHDQDFIVKKNSKYGLVSKRNDVKIPIEYDSLYFLSAKNNALVGKQKNHFGRISTTNKVIVDFKYEEIKNLHGCYGAKRKGKYSILDSVGHAITKKTFDDVGNLRIDPRGVKKPEMAVFNNGKFGFIDATGKITAPINKPSMARGFRDVPSIFHAFAKAIRSQDDTTIYNFCRDVVFDAYTQDYFLATGAQYRGFPSKASEGGVKKAVDEYYKKVTRFYSRLKDSGLTKSFVFTGKFDRFGWEYLDREQTVEFTEPWGIFKTDRRDFRIKIGELLHADGYWKAFTEFRTN